MKLIFKILFMILLWVVAISIVYFLNGDVLHGEDVVFVIIFDIALITMFFLVWGVDFTGGDGTSGLMFDFNLISFKSFPLSTISAVFITKFFESERYIGSVCKGSVSCELFAVIIVAIVLIWIVDSVISFSLERECSIWSIFNLSTSRLFLNFVFYFIIFSVYSSAIVYRLGEYQIIHPSPLVSEVSDVGKFYLKDSFDWVLDNV
jgi:hypothetical protein